MKTLHEIKKEKDDAISKSFEESGVFWAFSKEQFDENKTPLKEGEKYVDIGCGGYMPKSNVEKHLQDMKRITDTFKKQVKENKASEKYVLYELNNHEAFYTGTIDETMDALIGDYTREEVQAIYKKYKAKKYELCG